MEITEKINILNKYSITEDGSIRIYKILFDKPFHNLECTSPVELYFDGITINDSSWSEIIGRLVYTLSKRSWPRNIYEFQLSWNETYPFVKEAVNKSCIKISENLYFYKNYDADHAYKFIKEILLYFDIDISSSYLLIRRKPFAEPKEVADYFRKETMEAFNQYLQSMYGYDDLRCKKIDDNILNVMNPILEKVSKSYNDWFLFTDKLTVTNYSYKFEEFIELKTAYNGKSIRIMKRYIKYLNNFYKIYIK